MKPIAFLRSAFKRKGKKKSSKTPSSVEPLSLIPAASPLLTPSLIEVNPVLSLGFEYTRKVPIVDRSAITEIENHDILSPSTGLDLQGAHRSPLLSPSHDSLQNTSTAVFNLQGGELEHALQPPSYLWPRPPYPIRRSPTIVESAPEPQTRKMYISSLRQISRRIGIQKRACVSSNIAGITDEGSCAVEEIDITAMNSSSSSGHIPVSHASAASTSQTYTILDTPTSSTLKTLVCASSLSPDNLTEMPLETELQLSGENINSSQDTLASFPRPPPLKVKRRPQPLILLSTVTTDRLPPSPQVSSTDSTPSVTPLPTPRSPRFPNRPLHTVIPPRSSPPSTPLPTPPTSSVFLTSSDHRKLPGVGKVLRTAHSTSELRGHCFQDSYPVQNSVSSTPSADIFVSDNVSRWLSPALNSDYSSREVMEMPQKDPLYECGLSEIKVQWGYAI